MTTLQAVELGVLGPLQVRQDGAPVAIPGAKPRAVLTMLGLHHGSVVSADTLVELLWGEDPPRTAAKALQTHISALRRALGDGFVLTQGTGWALAESEVDASRYKSAARLGRDAAATGDISQAVAHFEEALALWRGIPELPDGRRGTSEKTRWIEGHAALVEDRADALLATARAAEIIGELEAAVADAPLRERRWGQLMLALYRAGRQGDALGAYQRARTMLADELGIDPGPELRRLETAIVAQDASLDVVVAQQHPSVMRAVTFLLTDIEGSTAAWEADAAAMAVALARHDELVEQVVTSRGGRLIKTRGEGDATFSVFERPSAAAAAAMELQDAITHEQWGLREPMRIRIALHTGEVELRDGDYFGRAVNRAARLRSLAVGGQILCSGATAELVVDSLPDDVILADLGLRELRNLARPEHVFELRLETAEESAQPPTSDAPPMERPGLPSVLIGTGPFVGRGSELEKLLSAWQTSLGGGACAALIAGEPGVGKTRLAGEWSRQAYEQGAVVLYGRCDEDLGAPYQPFAEALRSMVPCVGTRRLRGLRGVEALLPLVPGLADEVPDLAAPTRADPDTERYALFDAVVALLEMASTQAPIVLVLDDLHWAAKATLLLLRHLLRFGDRARVQIVGTYRSTDLDRSHPLAAMLADLHRDGTANRISLSGLDEDDVSAYVAKAGYDDEELGHALASVTGGNPFFLIEALRHVDESGGVWDPSTLPQGVREAVSRRLSRLPIETNKALAAAAVVGSRFALDLVERVVGDDLVDAFDEASKAGIVIEEPGGRYRFNHAIVRQSLLAELPSMRRMRLHQRIATTLEDEPGADDELLAELAHHYFECAWAGNAAKAVEYCRRAADQAMARLAYEGAADLYDHALHALDEIDDELPDRDDQVADLLLARCEALLAAGDVASAAGAVSQLQQATVDSTRLSAWATCFDGQLSVLVHPERLDDVETALGNAAHKLAEIDDAAGEAKAHTVRATCLARLGRIGDCEIALDDALTAARRARDHRRVNAVLAGAPLAALWGPNPVPRAGGRCLDVVRLLRITTDSPAVEATSTRCQAVLEAFRGRDAAARRMIDSARRTVTELGLRHALLEVEQFGGIVELVLDDPAAAEPHLRKAYNGFRRMGLDADTAETAALLGRACLALNRDAEADELCTESERLAGHALKASIAWRTLRAQLLSRSGDHDEARRVAQAAITLAERTDGLVDHGDACLSLARVLGAAGDAAGARAAAERAANLYERKGAAALADKARSMLDERVEAIDPTPPEVPAVETRTAAVQTSERVMAAIGREDWDQLERLFAPEGSVESRRKVVGFNRNEFRADEVIHQTRRDLETGILRLSHVVIAVRGDRLALARVALGTADASPGAPQDELLQLYRIDEGGRIALQIWFDLDDMDAALAELDALHDRSKDERPPARRLENAATRVIERVYPHYAARDWDALAEMAAESYYIDDRRRTANAGIRHGRDAGTRELQATAEVGFTMTMVGAVATRGERLVLTHIRASGRNPETIQNEALNVVEIDADEKVVAAVVFDLEDFDAAFEELDARYLAGEAADYARTWSVITTAYSALNRREMPPTTTDWVNIDHRRGTTFAPGQLPALLASWTLASQVSSSIEAVHRLNNLGAVVSSVSHETSQEGFDAEWRGIAVLTIDGDLIDRLEIFDETDLPAAIARFDELSRPAKRLENTATRVFEGVLSYVADRDWDAVAATVADSYSGIDHRRVVNAENQHGRDAVLNDVRVAADIGFTMSMSGAIAIRGERLVLARVRVSGRDPETIQNDALNVVEIDADEKVVAVVVFDLEDFETAIAEFDARYLAGEAAAHAQTWSSLVTAFAGFNRRELDLTHGWVNMDHRRGPAFAAGDMAAYIHDLWNDSPDVSMYVEVVHRLSDFGVVITQTAHGTSQHGFEAEWRENSIFTFDSDLVSRCELFDEEDLDAAIARFDQLSQRAPRLENAASRANARLIAYANARDWDSAASILADDHYSDDRRRVTGAGTRRGPDADIENFRAVADLGSNITVEVVATRGDRLVLTHNRVEIGDTQHPFTAEFFGVVETNLDGRIAAVVELDLEDFDAAFAELDARYLAGEAAAYARTWSVIAGGHAALNRRELPPTTPDCVSIDHRRGAAFAPGELVEYFRAGFDLDQDIRTYVEVVHRLSELGAVCTHAGHGVSREGFDAEWRGIDLLTVDEDMVSRCEVFEETNLDAAIAQFDQLSRPTPRLENPASQAFQRVEAYIAVRDWDGVAEIAAEDFSVDDRRRVVNAGIRYGRDAAIRESQSLADVGFTLTTVGVMATRGARLALVRVRASASDPEAILSDAPNLVEIDADGRVVAIVIFDLDDLDAAIAELDARYLAGEAAAHAHTWSVIAGAYAAFNRRELLATTPDWVNIDHRRGAAFAPGDMIAYLHAAWDDSPDTKIYIGSVHGLGEIGAVVSHVAHGISQEGLDAEWRDVQLLTVDGEMISRSELFNEADLDAAIAQFDQLSQPAPRLENAASRVDKRFQACFAARDWDVMAKMLSDGFSIEDRRRVVNMGNLHGRDAEIGVHAYAVVGSENVTSTVIATRAQRLALSHYRFSGRDQRPDAFRIEMLVVVEIDANERMATVVVFDADDFDAAIAELDARYVAGEAAAHAETWLVIAEVYAALNRGEMPATAPDLVDIDHRSLAAIGSGDLMAYLQAASDDAARGGIYIETVHRLTDLGAVTTHVTKATSREGFDAEWRITSFFIVGGDRVNRYEIFDEADLEAALAGFEALSRPTSHLENAASQVAERFLAHFAARDWAAMADTLADGFCSDDRRRVVNAGILRGRDAEMANFRSAADLGGTQATSNSVATRGERLVLARVRYSRSDENAEPFHVDLLQMVEIAADERITAFVVFDLDDFDAAIEELDARYIAGEGAAHADTWSLIVSSYAAFNRHELPAADWDTVDHRRATPFASSTMTASLRAILDLTPDLKIHIEAVHRLSSFGAVITHTASETSPEGFDAEWRAIDIVTVEGDRINRCEIYDEEDFDAAIARFNEFGRPARRLENTASQVYDSLNGYFAARDWAAMAEIMTPNIIDDDRQRMVNSGTLRGRDAVIANARTGADLGTTDLTSTVIATRGDRLALCRTCFFGRGPSAFRSEALHIVEIDADERAVAHVSFDVENTDAAFTELDARYIAGEAAAYSRAWSVIAQIYVDCNRHQFPATTTDPVFIDHRPLVAIAGVDMAASIRAVLDLTPDVSIYVEAVHRLNSCGAVVSHALRGTSHDGFVGEWQMITIFTVEDDLMNRCEIFDEADLDAALARFDELQRQARRVENTASRASGRYLERVVARDWDTIAERLADDYYTDDRRHVVGGGIHGRDAEIASARVQANLGVTHATPTVIAVRGERLALSRVRYSGHNRELGAFVAEMLIIFEMNADGRFAAAVAFDLEDFEVAIAELDARYLAGEAAAHARAWSVIVGGHAAVNRRDLPPTTPDCVSIDHRRGATFAPGELTAYFRAGWDLDQDVRTYVEVVHRLSDLGTVCTHVGQGASREGFDAEWRGVNILTLDGDLISRSEVFDEADLDAALARFDELDRPAGRLENLASRVAGRFLACFAAREWDAMPQILGDNFSYDDRRRVVGSGVRHGGDAHIADMRASADLWTANVTPTVLAIRGERLVLARLRFPGRDQGPEAFVTDVLGVVEIDADERIVAFVSLELDDFDAALAELDARYLAGEAADQAHTWSVIVGMYASFNRHELPATTPDWVTVDHRPGATFEFRDATAFFRATWDLTPQASIYAEAVHRMTSLGAVVTHVVHGTSQDGFDAEWRQISMYTVEGDLISGCELFDEADLDAALARFDELNMSAPRLENTASQVCRRFRASFAAHDWDAVAGMLAQDFSIDDRRRVVNAGIRHGRDAEMEDLRASADLGVAYLTAVVIATRGQRLVLIRGDARNDERPEAFQFDVLQIVEINGDDRIVAVVSFDLEDIGAAIKELDVRYLAGEAAAHPNTWSLIARAFAAINRHELPDLTSDWANIDHRRGAAFATGDMTAYIRDLWDDAPDINVYVEAVHCLTDCGAVISQAAHGTSQHGFEAEWRENAIFTFDGDLLSRCELFDERDLDAALARFDELHRQPPRLENAATRTVEQFFAHFAVRDWDAMAELLADDVSADDRRSVVNAGIRRGRDLEMANWRATDELWTINVRSTVATRGERLALVRFLFTSKDRGPQAFSVAALAIVEINDSNRIAEIVAIDADDVDTAFAELDARYLSGEAAVHARTWSLITRAFAALNQHELPPTTPGWVNIDHRSTQRVVADDLTALIRATWEVVPHGRVYIEAVHRLNDVGVAITYVARGTSQEGFDAEWRAVNISTVDGDMISRSEIFDETDLDTALARFDELHPQTRRLENAASRVHARLKACVAARDWNALTEILADDISIDDRRRAVNSGIQYGRDAAIADMRGAIDLGLTNISLTVIAIREARLELCRMCICGEDRPDAFRIEFLSVVEINADERIVARVAFDLDDIEGAFAELDARYLAGEAAAHAHTWSVVSGAYASMNGHELFATTPDWVNVDHRRPKIIEQGGLNASLLSMWTLIPDVTFRVEAVHRLTNVGAVCTHVAQGISQDGFDAEWRGVELLTVDGDLINRCEIFDETELDAAIAKFEELHPHAPRLENAASHVADHFLAYFAAGDWDAMAEVLADNFSGDDRRRVVGAGIRHGRDAQIADLRAIADLGSKYQTPTVLATRGERLTLVHHRLSFRDQGPEGFLTDVLVIGEINADGQIVAAVSFDLDDIDAAFDELDARYLAGEAAAHADTWSVIVAAHARFNRQELPATTPDPVYIDHRPIVSIEGADLAATLRAVWDITPASSVYIEAVHRLDQLGAVATQVLKGTSPEGLDAEWRMIDIFTVEGDLYSGVEIFDEADLDAALARFEELHPQAPQLENAASQVEQRFMTYFAARDWDAYADILSEDVRMDDRRHVVNAGVRHGRDAEIASMRAIADVGVTHFTSTVIAIRGRRLTLGSYSVFDGWSGSKVLSVSEINAENQIVARVAFDPEDFDAAIAELDTRYLAGEAADHAHTWSVVMQVQAAWNRHEFFPNTEDWVNVDHRRGRAYAPGELKPFLRATWNVVPDAKLHTEAVHRLTNAGVVSTVVATGTSQEGFDAEWREIALLTFDGDLINHCEIFDESDLDAALARFDELHSQTSRLENAASQVGERFLTCFAARDWEGMAELLEDDYFSDDRRRVVGAGVRHGRDAQIADLRAIADLWITNLKMTVIATRGERLVLTRTTFSGRDQGSEAFLSDVLDVAEINANGRYLANVSFELDDLDAAFAELEARYLAGEAAAHAHTWSLVMQAQAAWNRHEIFPNTEDWVNVDHRRGRAYAPGELKPFLRASWNVIPDAKIHTEAVHRLTNVGVVSTVVATGTSQEGFDAEWREIALVTFDGGLLSRCELFDEADLDAALARFDELQLPTRQLENAATRADDRFFAYIAARNWAALAEILTDGSFIDDRRPVVNAGLWDGRDPVIANLQAVADAAANITSVIATRGDRLALTRIRSSNRDPGQGDFGVEKLNIVEIDTDERIVAHVEFDPNDIDAAFAELEARYLAGEAAAHAHTWSVLMQTCAAIDRHEMFATTKDFVDIDHRSLAAIRSGDLMPYIRAAFDDGVYSIYIEAVHRLSDFGAVVALVARGTSQGGFEAEWRMTDIFTVEGDLISRCEIFDDADLDAALAGFEELHPPAPRLENAATQVYERLHAYFVIRDWAAITEMLGDGYYQDDGRPVVGGGIRRGPNALIQDLQAAADLGVADATSNTIAIRGERLALTRVRYSRRDEGPEPFYAEFLQIVEIDADARIAVLAALDLDHVDTAFEQLDARYLAGEAAAHAHTWSVVSGAYAAMNRHELPATTPDWVNVDHRRGIAFAPGDASAYLRAWVDSRGGVYVETVHRLSNLGAVFTWAGRGTSQQGFEAEWRGINVLTVEGDRINRGEIFDEADLDAALARFDELQTQARRVENAATQVSERFLAQFAAGDWDAMPKMMADNFSSDDRRRVVGAGVRHGRNAQIMDMRAIADLGITNSNTTHLATRGKRLALSRTRMSGKDHPFYGEMLDVLEINADAQIVKYVVFDLDDVDAAFAELDARYLAGEAADHAHTWALIAGLFAGFNRHELAQTTSDFVAVDHRRLVAFAPGDIREFARTAFDQVPDLSFHVEAVHRLSNLGAVVTQALRGTSREGFEAEWCEIHLVMIEGDLFNRSEIFDEADLDAALARFDELHPQPRRLENAASQAVERFWKYFAAREWAALAEIMADDLCSYDRRRVVNGGELRGRAVHVTNMRAVAEVGFEGLTSTVIASRGQHLTLIRIRSSVRGSEPGEVTAEMLSIIEIDTDNRLTAALIFDGDDFDPAIAELDARYLAGEAAANAPTWSVIAGAHAGFNRHKLPATTPDPVYIDHRPLVSIEGADLAATLRAVWDITPAFSVYIEAVHRLDEFGAVATQVLNGTSQEGLDAEWRMIDVFTVEGDLISRVEVFEEADLDAALARFEELHPQAPRLENAATQVDQRFWTHFAARDWAAMAELLADDISTEDRRRVVNAGVRHGRDSHIAEMRAVVEVGVENITSSIVATRGSRLALTRICGSSREIGAGELSAEVLNIVEINADNQILSRIGFDIDDIDGAFEELDARYLAGEATPYANTWTAVAGAYAGFNRHEIRATPDWVNVDHRRGTTVAPGDMAANIRATWDVAPNISRSIEAVHRLDNIGAVVTHTAYGTSREGFDAEWRLVALLTFTGDLISRAELFDETDLDAALARFDELQLQAPRLENAATRAEDRFFAYYKAHDWAAIAEILADGTFIENRVRVVNTGLWEGRDVVIANMQALAEGVANSTSAVFAIRGERLALTRMRYPNSDARYGEFVPEQLIIAEIDTDDRIAAQIVIDPDDIDAAIEELDARYLAGEAAGHARTWSAVMRAYTELNRGELPTTTPDFEDIDHRRAAAMAPGELIEYLRAALDQTPELSIYIEAVHLLSDRGAIVTHAAHGTSREGFDAEWREVSLVTAGGDTLNRCELFDETDLDAALARFDELDRQASSVEQVSAPDNEGPPGSYA